MNIDFEVKEIVYRTRLKINKEKCLFTMYKKGEQAIKKKWNSLYFSENNHIFASIKYKDIFFCLKTQGNVKVRVNYEIINNPDDVFKVKEAYSIYEDELNICRLIDNKEPFNIIESNKFCIIKAKDIYEALYKGSDTIELEQFKPKDYIELGKILTTKINEVYYE